MRLSRHCSIAGGSMRRPTNGNGENQATQILCDLLASGCANIRSTAFADQAALASLTNAGALVESGTVDNVWCDACDPGHLAAIRTEFDGGRLGWICPDYGFIPAETDALRSYHLNIKKIALCLSKGLTPWKTQEFDLAPGFLWRLGRYEFGDKRVELLLVPRVDGLAELDRVQFVTKRIQKPDIGFALTANGQKHRAMAIAEKYYAWPLNDVLRIDSNGELCIDRQELEAIIQQLLPAPPEPHSGRPSRLQSVRSAYEELVREKPDIVGRNLIASAIYNDWAKLSPGTPRLGLSTIKGHLTVIMNDNP